MPRLCFLTSTSDQASSVSQQGLKGGVRIEKKKTIRQHYNMTPASAEAEAGLFFSSLLLHHSRYMQRIELVLGQRQSSQGTNKALNKVHGHCV